MAEAAVEPISVSDAVSLAATVVSSLPRLTVVGEVSGFRGPNARSGHCYFEVKDESSSMHCIVWRNTYSSCGFELKDGLEIQLTGKFDVYTATGSMSFVATKIEVSGEGALRQKVAALARKLQAEGLMDDARKLPISQFCTRVALVTSLSGSVIDDVKRTLSRRNPLVELLVFGCAVQGEGAEATIIRALKAAEAQEPDCILLVRGGGSYEDLMTFNDEALARTISACTVPIITGIGHEPDTTIADMVSDRRASTPTAAAESVAPAISEIISQIQDRQTRLGRAISGLLTAEISQVELLSNSAFRALQSTLEHKRIALDALASHRCLVDPLFMLESRRNALELGAERFYGALPRSLAQFESSTSALDHGLKVASTHMLGPYSKGISQLEVALNALSPLDVLKRGYAIVRDEVGHVVTRSSELSLDAQIEVLLGEGSLGARVTELKETGSTSSQDTGGAA